MFLEVQFVRIEAAKQLYILSAEELMIIFWTIRVLDAKVVVHVIPSKNIEESKSGVLSLRLR